MAKPETLVKSFYYTLTPKQKELIPAEVAQMVGAMPSVGGGAPDMQAMMRSQGSPQGMQAGGMPGMM